MNISKIFLYIFIFLIFQISAFAQTAKNITLKDGSTIKGQVTNVTDGIYTVQTDNLGTIQIKDENIQSISAQDAVVPQQIQATDPALQNQMNQVQGAILSDPELMQDIQTLIQDPQIMQMLQDPQFIDAVKSQDVGKIQQNQKTQELINNPQMQQLMEKINQKLGKPTTQETQQ